MICNKCNHFSPDNSAFCQHCGEKFELTQSAIQNHLEYNAEEMMNISQNAPSSSNSEGAFRNTHKSFCTKCGRLIDPITHLCPVCDNRTPDTPKPKSGKFIIIIIILAVLATILLALNVIQFLSTSGNISDINILQEQIRNNEELIKQRDETISSNEQTIDDQLDTITDLESQIEELEEKTDKMNFYEEHVVVVADDGTNLYHKYGCEDFDDSSFWAYNSEAAIVHGYDACSKCN